MVFLKSKFILVVSMIALLIVALPVDHALAQGATGKFCVEAHNNSLSPLANAPFVVKDSNGVVVGSFLTDTFGIGCLDLDPGSYTASIQNPYWGGASPATQTATVTVGQTSTVSFMVFIRVHDTGAPGTLCVSVVDDNSRLLADIGITVRDPSNAVIANLVSNAVTPQCVSIAQGNYSVLVDSNPYRIVRPPNPQYVAVIETQPTNVIFSVALRMHAPPVVAVAAPDVSGVEGSAITTSGKFSAPGGDPLGGWIVSPNIGSLVKSSDGSWTWTYMPTDNGSGTVTVTASDGQATVSDSFNYSVANVPPTITAFMVSPVPAALNTKVTAKATYTDRSSVDTATWVILWDDGNSSTGNSSANANISADHIYSGPGVYEVLLQVTDKDGGTDSEVFAYVVVYNPNQPYVHGDGEFISAPGAYPTNPQLTSKVHLGVHVDYPRWGMRPMGNFEFKLERSDLDFHSAALDWSVVSGNQFTLKGVGKAKSTPGFGYLFDSFRSTASYGFLFSSLVSTQAGQDKVRVKIWETAAGKVIYDNQPGAPDDALPTQLMPKGDIKIK